MTTPSLSTRRTRPAPSHLVALLSSALLLSACASDPNRAYAPEQENSASDAQNQYQNFRGREAVRAPSQLQLTLPERSHARKQNDSESTSVPTAVAAVDLPPNVLTSDTGVTGNSGTTATLSTPTYEGSPWVRDTQTYMGTVPCITGDNTCHAQRVTLTLSPNGRWRSRAVTIEPPQTPLAQYTDEGCWRVSGEQRERITLFDAKRTLTVASFSFSQGNALVLRTLHGKPTTLSYRLSRQPDLDPINELGDTTLDCQITH